MGTNAIVVSGEDQDSRERDDQVLTGDKQGVDDGFLVIWGV